MTSRPLPPALGVVAIGIAALLALQIGVRAGVIGSYLVPAPSEVFATLPGLLMREGLADRMAESFWVAALACMAAIVLGVPLGGAMERWPVLRAAFQNWFAVLAAVPPVLLYPLVLVAFGRGIAAGLALGIAAALPPVVLHAQDGFAAVPTALRRLGRGLHMTAAQRLRFVVFPAVRPALRRGIRLGWLAAILTVVGTEYLTQSGGLGELLADLGDRFAIPQLYATVACIGLVNGFVLRIMVWGDREQSDGVQPRPSRTGPSRAVVGMLRLTVVALLLAAWQTAATAGRLPSGLLPTPLEVAAAAWTLVAGRDLWFNLAVTAGEVAGAVTVGASLGLLVGAAIGSVTAMARVTATLLDTFAGLPKIVLFPVMLLGFGLGWPSKVAIGTVAGFFPMALTIASAVGHLDPRLRHLGRSLRMSRRQAFTKLYLPASLPAVATGLRLSAAAATALCLLAELKVSKEGIGFMIMNAFARSDFTRVYATTGVAVVLVAACQGLWSAGRGLRRAALGWPRVVRQPERASMLHRPEASL